MRVCGSTFVFGHVFCIALDSSGTNQSQPRRIVCTHTFTTVTSLIVRVGLWIVRVGRAGCGSVCLWRHVVGPYQGTAVVVWRQDQNVKISYRFFLFFFNSQELCSAERYPVTHMPAGRMCPSTAVFEPCLSDIPQGDIVRPTLLPMRGWRSSAVDIVQQRHMWWQVGLIERQHGWNVNYHTRQRFHLEQEESSAERHPHFYGQDVFHPQQQRLGRVPETCRQVIL